MYMLTIVTGVINKELVCYSAPSLNNSPVAHGST